MEKDAVRAGKAWTDAERRTLTRLYPRMTAAQLARRLGRSVYAVQNEVELLGLAKLARRTVIDEAFLERLRARNAAGYSDQEIADEAGCMRRTVERWRKRLGLGSNLYSERRRQRARAKTADQCARAGVARLAEIRSQVFRQRVAASGWPADLRPRAAAILDLLAERGPMTRRELCEAMGMNWRGSRASLKSSDPEGSHLAHLMACGLVVALGRIVRPGGRGYNQQLYSLDLTAERRWD